MIAATVLLILGVWVLALYTGREQNRQVNRNIDWLRKQVPTADSKRLL